MARETKIGLLVGMGFIVCFAIILSNRGADNPANIRRSLPSMADASEASDTLGQAERRARDYSKDTQVGHQRGGPTRGPRDPRTDTSRTDTSRPETPRIVHPEQLGGTPVQPPPTTRTRTISDIIDAAQANQTSTLPTRGTTPPTHREPEPPKNGDKLIATPQLKTPAPATPPAPEQTYTVAAGDSLSKIARKQYGTSRKDVVDALFNANRDTLKSPDRVQVGQTLVLPHIDGVPRTPHAADAAEPANRTADKNKSAARTESGKAAKATSAAQPKATWRWYQVRKGDRYETIARRELGDARRWREIHQLNKKIFPDSSKIRWGVRIKIPVDPRR